MFVFQIGPNRMTEVKIIHVGITRGKHRPAQYTGVVVLGKAWDVFHPQIKFSLQAFV